MCARFIFLSLLCALLNPLSAASESLRFAVSSSWSVPYGKIENDRLVGGINFELAHDLGQSMALPVEFIVLPRKRLDQAGLAGEFDLRCNLSPQWTSTRDSYAWSGRFFELSDVIFGAFTVPDPQRMESLLPGASISTVLGYIYPTLDPLFASAQLKRDDSVGQENVMLKVNLGRTSYGVSDALTLDWFQRSQPKLHLAPWRIVIARDDFQCAVPAGGRIPATKIFQALEVLKKTGRIEHILRNFR